MDRWVEAVVASLCRSKQRGLTFDQAWTEATRVFRPSPRLKATVRMDGEDTDGTLFVTVTEGMPEDSLADATYRFAWDAWHGESPTLRHFTLDMLRDEPGDSRVNDGLGKLAA